MSPVNLKEARKRLGALIRAAERGESVLITRRGREVARIGPVERRTTKRLPDLTAFRAAIKVKKGSLTSELLAMRDEERY